MKVGDLVKDNITGVRGIVIEMNVRGGVQGMTGVAVLGARTYYFPETRLEIISRGNKERPEEVAE